MVNEDKYELHVENVEEVRFALPNLDLLHKGLQEDLDGNGLIFVDDVCKVPQHKLSYAELLMILDEEESELLVYDRCVGIFLGGEFVKQTE